MGPTPVQEEKTSPEDGEDWEEGTQVYDSEVEVDLEKEVAAPPGKATKAADKPSSQPAKPAMPAVVPHPIGQTYSKPYRYSATGAWAIRRRYGDKKQILQLRGNEEKAQQVLHKALERLHHGMAEEKVIMWAKKQNIQRWITYICPPWAQEAQDSNCHASFFALSCMVVWTMMCC